MRKIKLGDTVLITHPDWDKELGKALMPHQRLPHKLRYVQLLGTPEIVVIPIENLTVIDIKENPELLI